MMARVKIVCRPLHLLSLVGGRHELKLDVRERAAGDSREAIDLGREALSRNASESARRPAMRRRS
jgi:hypothetical protein